MRIELSRFCCNLFNAIPLINYYMSDLYCRPDGSCPFLYSCIEGLCVHEPLLPPTVYTAFVYLLIPILLSLANVGGLSGGFLKVPILMDLLNYS